MVVPYMTTIKLHPCFKSNSDQKPNQNKQTTKKTFKPKSKCGPSITLLRSIVYTRNIEIYMEYGFLRKQNRQRMTKKLLDRLCHNMIVSVTKEEVVAKIFHPSVHYCTSAIQFFPH